MLVLFSLLAAIGFSQCAVNTGNNVSQQRRECKKKEGCKWSSAFFEGNNLIPGSCNSADGCESLNANKCKKRNNCYINWTAEGQPCQDYDENQAYPCNQLGGKKNQEKCDKQPGCIRGSGDRQNKECVTIPADLQDRECSDFDGKPNKYICMKITKCRWEGRGKGDDKKCLLKKKPEAKTCTSIDNRQECINNMSGCTWAGGRCAETPCPSITDRDMCNMSGRGCTWYKGLHADEFDRSKNKEKQKIEKVANKDRAGTCKNGVNSCDDIKVRNHCQLAKTKYDLDGCYWNEEAQEMGQPQCSTRKPCAEHTRDGRVACEASVNMDGGSNRCVWQVSGSTFRCLEFDCKLSARVQNKNACNTVGCHWHRNKDKRDPTKVGFCDVKDDSKGRRL